MKTYIIFAPSFDYNSGGIVALHKLCHLLNISGIKSYLFPYFGRYDLIPQDRIREQISTEYEISGPINYSINPSFNTPVLGFDNLAIIRSASDIVVVYPEITAGNPLGARNVVRWFLHHPGFHTGKAYYATGELYFRHGSGTSPAIIPGSRLSDLLLTITHLPVEYYNKNDMSPERKGTAYCIRKGRGREIIHDLENSICIDGKSHHDISRIFKSVEMFISYDIHTYYSKLAVLCGCDSVVVPIDGISEEECYPDAHSRLGIAYGFDNIMKARQSAAELSAYLMDSERNCSAMAARFVEECEEYFSIEKSASESLEKPFVLRR